MIESFISEIENDIFIPQMLVHQKSADFIPERISEIFGEFLEEEFAEYQDYVIELLNSIQKNNQKSSIAIDQDKFANKRTLNQLKLQNQQIKMELDISSQKLTQISQRNRSSINEIESKIKKIENSISNIYKCSSRLRILVQKFGAFCFSERNLFEENINIQRFELNQFLKKTNGQVNAYEADLEMVKNESSPKLGKLIVTYKERNKSLKKAMNQILSLFNGSLSEDIQSQISEYILQIHQPLFVGETRIRIDQIERSIEKSIKQKDLEILQKISDMKNNEQNFTEKIETFKERSLMSPRNLRVIYANRKKQSQIMQNSYKSQKIH